MLSSSRTHDISRNKSKILEGRLLMCYRDKSGALVYLSYGGVVDITPELGLILGGSPDAKTTAFGNSCKSLTLASPSC